MEFFLGIALIIALAALGLLLFLQMRNGSNHNSAAEAFAAEMEQRLKMAEEAARQQQLTYERSANHLLEETRRQYERQIEMLRRQLEEQAEEQRQRSALEFSALAEKSLQQQSERLRDANRSEIDEILTPLSQKIEDFRRAVSDSYVKENSSREALSSRIDTLAAANAEIGKEAQRLANALRGNSAMQGRWGEIVLEQLLEKAGLMKGVHFLTQAASPDGRALRDDEGHMLRPDVILLLPSDQRLVIDSKAAMTAYFKFTDAETERDGAAALREHAAATRKHIDELASKQYHKALNGALEHTLMFIPNDAAYLAALRGDPEICEYALKHNVVLVSPAHLLSVVQLVSQLWRVENQNRNAEKIAAMGGQLYDKFVSFIADFEKIQRALTTTTNAYTSCMRHLSQGNASLVSRAERLREMGAKASKQIPRSLLDEAAAGVRPLIHKDDSELGSKEIESDGESEIPVSGRTA